MNHQTDRQVVRARTPWRFNQLALSVALAMGGLAALPGAAYAAAPDANQIIGNIATASYSDGSGATRSATSNPVNTTVLQVAGFTLTSDNTKYVTLGGSVVFPHTLTNTGNGTDTFELTASQVASPTDDFNLGTLAIYADADGNGVPDNGTNLAGTTVSLARDGVFTFVVVGYAPASGLLDGADAVVNVTADSQVYEGTGDDVADVTNVDTALITADAVINVTKTANVVQGPTGTVIEYTITYTNVGNNTATGVTLSDAIPAGTTYVDNSATWNGAVVTDGGDADVFATVGAPTVTSVTAAVGSVAPNVTGQIKFSVVVNATTAPGTLINTASLDYDPDGPGVKTPVTTPSNDVPFLVLQTRNVGANDSTTVGDDTGADDIVEVASALQGATVTFANEIWNQGNGTDTFNITYSNVSFPAGTAITLYKDDGVNVLQDTNGDFVVDTGPVAAGARYTVILKAVLPPGFTGVPAGPYDITKTATSTASGVLNNPLDVSDTVTDRLLAVVSSTVDLENAAGLGDGTGAANETDGGNPFTVVAVNPGGSATFVLNVENTSLSADNYTFLADDDGTFAGVNDLPAGWSVNFYQAGAPDCSVLGAAVVNTGTINAGATGTYCGVVTTPANAAPVTEQDIWFQITSPLTGSVDKKLDAVTVNTVRSIQMTTNNSGTVFPGGTVDYIHNITNNGNVLEGDVAGEVVLSAVNSTGAPNPWATQLFWDANNNGVLDVAEAVTPITDISAFVSNGAAGLDAGETIRIFARVISNVNALDGATDVATITATVTGDVSGLGPQGTAGGSGPATVSNTDTTQVNAGQIRLYKTQALDAACDGTADAPLDVTPISAKPGACIIYNIEARNEGTSPATVVVVNDDVPTFTTLFTTAGGRPTVSQGTVSPTNAGAPLNYTGNVQASFGTINGGQSASMQMSVKIDE